MLPSWSGLPTSARILLRPPHARGMATRPATAPRGASGIDKSRARAYGCPNACTDARTCAMVRPRDAHHEEEHGMGDILGLGVTHYPPLIGRDENMATILRTVLRDPGLPERYRDSASWPPAMRREYGEDGGTASAAVHRASLVAHFRRARKILDEFRPEVVIIWGDDQHENFTEDIIPPFCVLAYDQAEARHRPRDAADNVWGEGPDTVLRYTGHREAGKYLARRLLEEGVDMAYAYRPLHHAGLAHAFLNTLLYFDYDRAGFPYPVVAFQVNCYGRRVISQRGGRGSLAHPLAEADLDPPS